MTLMTAVRLQRTIPAPPDKVYRAWLEPELIRRWMAPAGLEVTRAEVAERVGGHYRIWHAGASLRRLSRTASRRRPRRCMRSVLVRQLRC